MSGGATRTEVDPSRPLARQLGRVVSRCVPCAPRGPGWCCRFCPVCGGAWLWAFPHRYLAGLAGGAGFSRGAGLCDLLAAPALSFRARPVAAPPDAPRGPRRGCHHRGEEDRRIKLGCVQPGEAPAVFGDALRYLAQAATYLYQDNARYWYSTQPTVTKLADDRAELLKREPEKVAEEIQRRVKEDLRNRGEFPKVHAFPGGSGDVPDELDARLVVLSVDKAFGKEGTNLAMQAATEILEKRGNSPRRYRNTLVFLAADRSRLDELEVAARYYLAWKSICDRRPSSISIHSRPARRPPSGGPGTRPPRVGSLRPSNGCWRRCREKRRGRSNGRPRG